MKQSALAAGLAACIGLSAVGCKSTSKLAWWKKPGSTESTALVHTAPPLPSDLAKRRSGGRRRRRAVCPWPNGKNQFRRQHGAVDVPEYVGAAVYAWHNRASDGFRAGG